MRKNYERPVICVNKNIAEGVYLASGAGNGSVDASYYGVWDRWPQGGKGLVSVNCTGITGTVTVRLTFNDTIDQADAGGNGVQTSVSGQNVTLTFNGAEISSLTVGVHLNHGTSIDDLQLTDYSYSVS